MLRSSRGPLIAGAIVAVVTLLLVFFVVLPKMGEVSRAQDDLAAAQAQQSTLESQLAALEQAELAAPESKAIIQDVQRKIPPTADLPGLILLLKHAALSAGVTLTTQTPGTPVLDPATGLSSINVALSVDGSYFALTEFLYNIETLPRAAKVVSPSISPGGDTGDGTIATTTLQMTTTVIVYTSDTSAGPGSEPGPTENAAAEEI